jgi:hypothetical protein
MYEQALSQSLRFRTVGATLRLGHAELLQCYANSLFPGNPARGKTRSEGAILFSLLGGRVIAGGRVYGIRPLSFRHETFARYRPQNVRAPGSVLERMVLLLFFLTSAFLLFPSGGETVGARAFTPMEGGLPRVTCVSPPRNLFFFARIVTKNFRKRDTSSSF